MSIKKHKKVPIRPKERFIKIHHENKKWNESFFNIFNTFIAILIGGIGIYLAMQANKLNIRMLAISEKQDSTSVDLKHFSKLLSKTDTVISDLNTQLVLLREQQFIADKNIQIEKLNNEGKFYFAVQKLQSIIVQSANYSNLIYTPESERESFIKLVESILESQLGNPFLTSNVYISKDWIAVHDTLHKSKIKLKISDFENNTLEIRNKIWLNLYFTVLDLSNNTNGYIRYYYKNKSTVFPKDYLEIKRKLGSEKAF